MKKPLILIATSLATSLSLLHLPSFANGEAGEGGGTNPGPNIVITDLNSDDNILGDNVTRAVYQKPDAYEAERAIRADVATHAERADFADHALNADFADRASVAVRVEQKLPFGRVFDFGIAQSSAGSRTFTQY